MGPSNDELYEEFQKRIASIRQHFATSDDLSTAFERSRDAISTEARRVFPGAKLQIVGPDKNECSGWWGCYIEVDTDERRDAFRRDEVLSHRLEQAGIQGGFPPTRIEIESRETVRRDYNGSWFLRLR